jgi:hypothetical protein
VSNESPEKLRVSFEETQNSGFKRKLTQYKKDVSTSLEEVEKNSKLVRD